MQQPRSNSWHVFVGFQWVVEVAFEEKKMPLSTDLMWNCYSILEWEIMLENLPQFAISFSFEILLWIFKFQWQWYNRTSVGKATLSFISYHFGQQLQETIPHWSLSMFLLNSYHHLSIFTFKVECLCHPNMKLSCKLNKKTQFNIKFSTRWISNNTKLTWIHVLQDDQNNAKHLSYPMIR